MRKIGGTVRERGGARSEMERHDQKLEGMINNLGTCER